MDFLKPEVLLEIKKRLFSKGLVYFYFGRSVAARLIFRLACRFFWVVFDKKFGCKDCRFFDDEELQARFAN